MESPTAGPTKSNLRTRGGVSAKSLVYCYLVGAAEGAAAVWASHVKGSERNDQLAAPAGL
jgi:D-alanyl-D-alanine carboxypeptidase